MMRKNIIIALIFLGSGITTHAQQKTEDEGHDKGLETYASFSGGFPVKGMEHFDYSFGAYTHFDYNFNEKFVARLDIGWNEFNGPKREYVDVNNVIHKEDVTMSVWEFTAGARYRLTPWFYIEGRGGYFTGIHTFGGVPAIGFKFHSFDIQTNMIMTKNISWAGFRIGYFF